MNHCCELPPFTCSHTYMDTLAGAVLSHCDPELSNYTYEYVIAPKIRLVAFHTLCINLFPQLIDSFLTMTGDSKNNALCIVYSHLQVTHKKWNFWWPILPCGNHDCITMRSIFTQIYPNCHITPVLRLENFL